MTAHRAYARAAVVTPMASPGTYVAPALEALFAACHGRYGDRVFTADVARMPDLAASSLVRARTAEALHRASRIASSDISVQDLRSRGVSMLDALSALQADVFVLGDAGAMRLSARLALWSREHRAACRWIGIPACPYNSVPFTASSIGFGSALNWCAALGTALRAGRQRDHKAAPIGILDISGDTTGWLAAGAAALAGAGNQPVFCITPGMALDADTLCVALRRAVQRDGHAVIFTGASARDTAGRHIASLGTSAAQAVREIITTHMRLEVVVMQVCPADVFDEAHMSARDAADSRLMARAAVRAACKGESCVVLNRRAPGSRYSLLTHTMPLLDVVSAPRMISAQYLRPKVYQPKPALRTYLQWFASRLSGYKQNNCSCSHD